jgi:hypothetical protein
MHIARTDARSRLSPEMKARAVLMLERARQKTVIRKMDAVHTEMVTTGKVLTDLLSDSAFVALLRTQGIITVPRLIHEYLLGHLQ